MVAALAALAPSVAAADAHRSATFEPPAPAQQLVTRWTSEEGLASNLLLDVLQSRDGYLWIASLSGLVRFDGSSFVNFDRHRIAATMARPRRAELRGNGVLELVEDRDGVLWIGTQSSGVLLLRDGDFHPLATSEKFAYSVRSLLPEPGGSVWVGTDDAGAFRFTDGRIEPVDVAALQAVSVRDILRAADGALWFATEGKGVTRLADGEASRTYTTADGLISNAASSLLETAEALWIGTQEGLSRLSDGRLESVPDTGHLEIFRLYEGERGSLWIASQQGAFRYTPADGSLTRPLTADGAAFGPVSALLVDREGSLWLASYGEGLFQLRSAKFSRFRVSGGPAPERVNFISEIAPGRHLIGADNGMLQLIRDDAVEPFPLATPVGRVRMRHALRARDGTLWISSHAGLLAKRGSVERLYTTADGLPTNQVRLVFEDRTGELWVGTRNAGLLRRLEGGGFETLDQSAGLSSNFILSLGEDAAGNLLVGTHAGLDVRAPDGSIRSYTVADGLPGSLVFRARPDAEGGLWIATNGGIARLRDGRVSAVSVGQGLPTDAVFDLLHDGEGAIWATSPIGVLRLEHRQLASVLDGSGGRLSVEVFDESDGLPHRECTASAAILKDAGGRLWFPTLAGVARIRPDRILRNSVPPLVAVDALVADSRRVSEPGLRPRIAAGTRELVFRFSVLSFVAPAKVRARYRLDGFETEWQEASGARSVRYTNLEPGAYTFHVIAANNDGVWDPAGASRPLRVLPLWHQRPTIRLLGLLAAAAVVAQLFRWRLAASRRRNAQLEQLVQKLSASREEVERFTYSISHDLKSPLVTIRGFLGVLERDLEEGDFDRVRHDLDRIDRATRSMASKLGHLLDLARIGRVEHAPRWHPLTALAEEALQRCEGPIREARATVRVAPDLPMARVDGARLVEVFQSLIENAIKFRRESVPPRVEVGWTPDGEQPQVWVRDNGIGIDPRFHRKIFDLFERLDPRREGTGVGLAIVRRVIESHGGRVWVESAGAGSGASFHFSLPETRQAPSPGDDGHRRRERPAAERPALDEGLVS